MKRSRQGRRLHRLGFTHEVTFLDDAFFRSIGIPKTIFIFNPARAHDGPQTPRKGWRRLALDGEHIRPAGTYYIHNGRKPR